MCSNGKLMSCRTRTQEIDHLSQTVSALQEAVTQYKVGAAAAEDKIISSGK